MEKIAIQQTAQRTTEVTYIMYKIYVPNHIMQFLHSREIIISFSSGPNNDYIKHDNRCVTRTKSNLFLPSLLTVSYLKSMQ